MRVLLINPNTSRAMTEKIAEAAREVAGPDVLIEAVCPADGADAIESHTDEIAAAAAVVELITADRAGADPADAYVIACFGDPGLDAARELVEAPVVGIAEAAMHLAAVSGRHFGVVTTLSRTLGRAHDLVSRYGMERACVSLAATGIPVLDLEDTGSPAVETIARVSAEAAASGADVIVLGCAGMADLCTELTARVGVPVVDGVAAAVGVASGMVRMGLGTSKRDEYAPPPRALVAGASAGRVSAVPAGGASGFGARSDVRGGPFPPRGAESAPDRESSAASSAPDRESSAASSAPDRESPAPPQAGDLAVFA
ncbi:aspartate/glutamate racemase family protein [Microbacterium sp. VKM Ac-2923]|uniref:aspartate/glutamate racemase family protein n=1 Tax=Microbacterium sp. VKM Ac-2923 TaxID=2929476 RepID=UPI001FB34F1A|nr:aspartate/glutamate racemase family protein [Microbacterium sp. VKM Ac-2923]MCJ1706065.1 aspartate/glutamate racemase family protein [Microbacterium sp. VKM Ac-2923]